jgi:hypothetical protein
LVKLADVTEGDKRRSVPLVERASKAEAGIGEGGEWIAGAAGSGSPPPLERGVALDHVMEPVAKECYTYTRSWCPTASRPPWAMKHGRTYAPTPYISE